MKNAFEVKVEERSWGSRRHVVVGFGLVALMVFGFGTWSATAELSGAVVAPGHIRVESNRQVVQHPDGGVVGEILVKDGDIVEAGDVLIRFDGAMLRSELKVLEGQLAEIMARRGRLEAEQRGLDRVSFDPELESWAAGAPDVAALLEGQRELFHARIATLEREIQLTHEQEGQIEKQIVGVEGEIISLERQAALISEELENQRTLFDKGLTQANRVLTLEREDARLQGSRAQLVAEGARLRGQISQLEIERLRLEAGRREQAVTELRELGFREIELKERRFALTEQLSRLDIRSPRPGMVYDMTVHTLNAVVRPAEPILYVAPSDVGLVVDARVDPIHVDELRPLQEASLRFSSFSGRKTPQVLGTVRNVSPDALADPQMGRSYYLTEIEITDEEIAKLGDHQLLAGMPVEVFIKTEERTALNYLVRPLTDYFTHAMREE